VDRGNPMIDKVWGTAVEGVTFVFFQILLVCGGIYNECFVYLFYVWPARVWWFSLAFSLFLSFFLSRALYFSSSLRMSSVNVGGVVAVKRAKITTVGPPQRSCWSLVY